MNEIRVFSPHVDRSWRANLIWNQYIFKVNLKNIDLVQFFRTRTTNLKYAF